MLTLLWLLCISVPATSQDVGSEGWKGRGHRSTRIDHGMLDVIEIFTPLSSRDRWGICSV